VTHRPATALPQPSPHPPVQEDTITTPLSKQPYSVPETMEILSMKRITPPPPAIPLPGPLYSGLLTTEEVAKVVGVDASTVRRWRTSDPVQGPPFIRISDRVTKYSVADVDEWLLSLRIDPRMAA